MYINKEKMEYLSKLRDYIVRDVTGYFNPDPWEDQGYLYYERTLERMGGSFTDFKDEVIAQIKTMQEMYKDDNIEALKVDVEDENFDPNAFYLKVMLPAYKWDLEHNQVKDYEINNLPNALPEHLVNKVLELDKENIFKTNYAYYFKRQWENLDKELELLKENNFKIFKQTEDVILLRCYHIYEDMVIPEEENAVVFPEYKVTFFTSYELMGDAYKHISR